MIRNHSHSHVLNSVSVCEGWLPVVLRVSPYPINRRLERRWGVGRGYGEGGEEEGRRTDFMYSGVEPNPQAPRRALCPETCRRGGKMKAPLHSLAPGSKCNVNSYKLPSVKSDKTSAITPLTTQPPIHPSHPSLPPSLPPKIKTSHCLATTGFNLRSEGDENKD